MHPLQARARVSPRCWTWLNHARIPVVLCGGPTEAAWKEVLISIESIAHGARQLLAYGAEIEVLEPTALRQAIYEQACDLVRRHQSVVAAHDTKQQRLAVRPSKPEKLTETKT